MLCLLRSLHQSSNKNQEQEVDDDLSVCALNLLPELSPISSLVAISLVKVEIQFYQFVT